MVTLRNRILLGRNRHRASSSSRRVACAVRADVGRQRNLSRWSVTARAASERGPVPAAGEDLDGGGAVGVGELVAGVGWADLVVVAGEQQQRQRRRRPGRGRWRRRGPRSCGRSPPGPGASPARGRTPRPRAGRGGWPRTVALATIAAATAAMPCSRTVAARSGWPACPARRRRRGTAPSRASAADLVRVAGREAAHHERAHRVPDDPRADSTPSVVEQRRRGRRRGRRCVSAPATGRAPGALHVGPDHPEALGQRLGLRLVEVRGPAEPVHQQHRADPRPSTSTASSLPLTCTTSPSVVGSSSAVGQPMRLRCAPSPVIAISTTSPADQELRRVEPDPDAGRGAGGDDVAGQQRDPGRERRDQLGDVEDQVLDRCRLAALAVDRSSRPAARSRRRSRRRSPRRAPSGSACPATCPAATACGRAAGRGR